MVLLYGVPELINTVTFNSRHSHCWWVPQTVLTAHHTHRRRKLAGSAFGVFQVRTVSFVNGHKISHLQDTLFNALQLIAGTGQCQERETIHHLGDSNLGLAHTDGFYQNHVVSGGLKHHHRFSGGFSYTAKRPRRWRRANKRVILR